jgi:hypothetical protein
MKTSFSSNKTAFQRSGAWFSNPEGLTFSVHQIKSNQAPSKTQKLSQQTTGLQTPIDNTFRQTRTTVFSCTDRRVTCRSPQSYTLEK